MDLKLKILNNVSDDSFDQITYEMYTDALLLQQCSDKAQMICAVYEHICKFGITAENTALFAASFEAINMVYSAENAFKAALTSIGNFFKRIYTYIKDKVLAFFDKLREWWNKLIVDKLKKCPEKVPVEQKDKFNKKMTEKASTEADSIIDPQGLRELDIFNNNGETISISNLIKLLTKLTDNQITRTAVISNVVRDIQHGVEITRERKNRDNERFGGDSSIYDIKLDTTPYAGGWAESSQLKKLFTHCYSVHGTMNKCADELKQMMIVVRTLESVGKIPDDAKKLRQLCTDLIEDLGIQMSICIKVQRYIQRATKIKSELAISE